MQVFFDTSVLVAAFVQDHPHYAQALPALRRVGASKDHGFISTHSIAEVYTTLTRLPVQPRIHPAEAARIVTDNILGHFEVVALFKEDYLAALSSVQLGGWPGPRIYDALLLVAAAKCNAERVYTFNLKDFILLAPPSLQGKLSAPS